MFDCPHNKGFTLPELIVSMAVILTIFAFGSINLLRVITNGDLDEISATFVADAKSQQSSAMLGDSGGLQYHSINIESDKYTLFRGLIYSGGAPGNYSVNCPSNTTMSTTFPNGVITFSTMNGEIDGIDGYDSANDQVTFTSVSGRTVVIEFNKLGNIVSVTKN